MKNRIFLLTLIVILLCSLLSGCLELGRERGLYNLGLEVNFETTLPAGGEVLYHVFAPQGKDAKEYAVVQYPKENTLADHFSWKPMDEQTWNEVNRLIDSIELYISRNEEEELIPSNLMPSRDMLYAMVGDFPDSVDPYAYFLYSPSDMRVYVLINLT